MSITFSDFNSLNSNGSFLGRKLYSLFRKIISSAGFVKEVLAGSKFLINLEQVRFVDEIPQFKELSTKNI